MQLHQALRDRLSASGRALRAVAKEVGVDAGNLSRFLSSGRGLGSAPLGRLARTLELGFSGTPVPRDLAWLQAADHWCALLRTRLPDMDPAELRQIVVSVLRPWPVRSFLLRSFGAGHAL